MEIVNGGSGLSLSYNGVTEFVAYNSIKTISPLQLRGDFYIVLHFTTEIVDSLKINLAKVTNQPTWTNDVVGIQTAVDDIINWIGLSGGGVQVDWNELDSSSDAFIKNKPTKLSDFEDDLDKTNLANEDQVIADDVRIVQVQGTTSDKRIEFINGNLKTIVEFLANRQVNTYGDVHLNNDTGASLMTVNNTEIVSYRNSRFGNAGTTQYHTMGGSTAGDWFAVRNSALIPVLKYNASGYFELGKSDNSTPTILDLKGDNCEVRMMSGDFLTFTSGFGFEFKCYGTSIMLMDLNGTTINGGFINPASPDGFTICSNATKKLSFWGLPPIVQPSTSIAAADYVANTSASIKKDDTFDGYTIAQVVRALTKVGILKS